ncbi:site-specific DNA-methyltransferase [Veillonella sp. T11011-6]|uniref:site-specific DNA-methyltransferase n=1 Tax=Veillonella sp. T11011-6 TaxID=2027459 RepID=UPI001E3F9FEA|nr:site-specific DNA-methyltransferase [Veillonella sp. T11011-6]
MESVDMTEKNIEKIESLFPNCITETLDENGTLKKAINFEALKQMLSNEVIDGDEAYEFTWVGKKAAIVEANKPIRKTLRPCIEKSVNWDNTENLYIEGDNLEVLKLLQESYLGKVDVIYIDPPYNTGNDFIYNDDFKLSSEEYIEANNEFDENGNRLFKNTDSNGRFHSDWCSMIYSRLLLSRNLLSDTGVIFISIDDNEQENLKKICDEVFGEDNFLAQIIWERAYAPINLKKHFSRSHDFILCYAKNETLAINNGIKRSEEADNRYSNPDNDSRGDWKADNFSVGPAVESNIYPITTPSGRIVEPPAGRSWLVSEKVFLEKLRDNRIWFGTDGNSVPSMKRFLNELKKIGITPMTIWKYKEVGHSQDASKALKELFDDRKIFDYPKPVNLIKRCIELYSKKDSIILDFFSGSATTAHSVMQLNAEDGGHRKYIMVQLAEKTDENSDSYKNGFKNICEIGQERIRKASKKILEDYKGNIDTEKLDTGFRVFKLDDSNMTDVYYSADEYSQNLLSNLESNIKQDRNDLDLLFSCLLEWGLPLSLPYNSEEIEGCAVHNYNNGDLVACFDEHIPDSVIKYIAKHQPLQAVFRDSSFESSPAKINVGEIFKSLAPDTRVKVI